MVTTPIKHSLIRQEQIYLLYKPSLSAAIATTVAAFFLAYIQWAVINHTTILIWLGIMSIIISLRIYTYFTFHNQQPTPQQTPYWETFFIILSICATLGWGSAGVFLFPMDNFEYQAATIVLIAGMAAGSVTTLSALRLPAFIFIIGSMTPLTINLLLEMNQIAISFAFMCSIYIFFLTTAANNIYNTHLQNISLRIQSLNREHKMQRGEALAKKTSAILELIAKGSPASTIYDEIALLYESRLPGIRCSMLELEGNKLMHGGAPSLPPAYCAAIHGLKNGPNVGACGTSTYTGERVLVENIATDPKWEKLKDLALAHDLHCCWSEPIKDSTGKVLGAFGMYRDHPALPNAHELTDLQEAAKLAGIVMERQRQEILLNKLLRAFECAHDTIIITDVEARIEYTNPAFERMTGYTSQEAVGDFLKILRSNQHPESFYEHLSKHDQSGEYWQGEIIIKRKDGSFLEVERSVSPVCDEHGNVMFLIAIQRDLTQHKALEAKFLQAQKMEAIGTLVGGIAHDFNNILAGITGNLYLVLLQLEQHSDLANKLRRIDALSTRAADLIQQMLTFARKDAVNMETLPLISLVKEVFKFLKTSIPDNIEMHLAINQEVIHITGDTTQLHQILLNLVNNSRDALEHAEQPYISIKLDTFKTNEGFLEQRPDFVAGDYAHLSVQDNGCGIPEENIKHLFEPFFTTKDVGKGTGLGLSMIFGAVQRHHGFIEVDSIPNQGTTFHIYLPLLETNTAEVAKESITTAPVQGNNEMILLVDDEPDILEMGSEVLEALGYKVLQASNGLEAVDVFTTHQNDIDLIITDIVMPKLGGVEAIERIRKIKPNIRAIFATGYDRDTALNKKIIANNDTLLGKPFSFDELNELIQQKIHNT